MSSKPACTKPKPNHGADDFLSSLVSDELTRRSGRLLERRRKQAGFRDAHKTLDNFDFAFNPKMNRSVVFDLATGAFIERREDALFSVPAARAKATWHRHRPDRYPAGLQSALPRNSHLARTTR